MTNSKQRGRPKGANSFANVSLADLNNLLGPQASVVVSKMWLRDLGIDLDAPQRQTIALVAPPVEEEKKIEFVITPFDQD